MILAVVVSIVIGQDATYPLKTMSPAEGPDITGAALGITCRLSGSAVSQRELHRSGAADLGFSGGDAVRHEEAEPAGSSILGRQARPA